MRTDIAIGPGRAPAIAGGDFVTGASDEQHALDIMSSSPGSWRFHPLTGADLARFIHAPVRQDQQNVAARAAAIQMQMDGYEITSFRLLEGIIEFSEK